MYDPVQDDYYAWDVEELPSKFWDYHPSWKKTKKTFLDLYFVAEKTKELIEFSREPNSMFSHLATSYENILKHLAVSKKRSIAILSKVLGLPDLVIDKIFINIVESYNWHFDKFGPEEMPWRYEEVEEDEPEGPGEDNDNYPESPGEDDDKYPEFYYNMISAIYENILVSSDRVRMKELGFYVRYMGVQTLKMSDSVSGDG